MKYVKEEYKTYKGVLEKNSPLKEKIEEYLNTTNSKGSKYTTPWCGAFVNWCFNQTKDYKNTNVGLNTLAFDWGTKEVAKKSRHKPDGWVNGETCDAFVGAVIVLSYSHTAFIVGKNTKNGRYVYLGGNQDDTIKLDEYGEYTSKSKRKKLYGFYIPADYNVTQADYLTDKDKNLNVKDENTKIGVVNFKKSGKTN